MDIKTEKLSLSPGDVLVVTAPNDLNPKEYANIYGVIESALSCQCGSERGGGGRHYH
jgi:hypothetical protein